MAYLTSYSKEKRTRRSTLSRIGMALAMRDLMRELRETGAVSGNNPSFTRNDRSKFLQALETAVQTIKRRGPPG